MDPLVILFGLAVGVLVGLTGVGGGSVMTPLLIIVFGINPITAVGTDLSYAAVTKTVGGFKHFRQRTVDIRLSTWMAFGSVPSAVGGVVVLKALERVYGHGFNTFMLLIVAAALLITGIAVFVRMLMPSRALAERQSARLETRDKVAAISIGAFVGFVLGMTSAGSGALIAVAMILVFRLVPTRVVGTGIFHAAILLWAAAAAHIVAGDVNFALAGTLLIGSVPGVWIGSHLAVRIPTGTLRTALGIVLIGSSLGLLTKAGLEVPTALLAATPAVLAAVLAIQLAVRRSRAALPAAERR